MTTSLHDRLADLAGDAPPGGPAPDLWERGRRYHRRRRAGTLAIVAAMVLGLLTIGTLDVSRSAPVPAPADGPAGLPDRIWTPSPWLPSSARPGRLVAITATAQGTWSGTRVGVAGISAETGAYAFLDLPDDWLEDVQLSPDGRHVAYWLGGDTTDTPNTRSGPITGVAVYDVTTGEVSRHWIPTPHGLRPDFLAWADADTLVFSAGQLVGGDDDSEMAQATSRFATPTMWRLGEEPMPVPGARRGVGLEGAAHGWVLLEHLLIKLDEPRRARRIEYPEPAGAVGSMHFVALGPSGQIATVPGTRNPGGVVAGPADRVRPVADSDGTWGVVDWIDADTIATLRRLGSLRHGWSTALYRITLATGASQELVRFPDECCGGSWQFATDLLDAPSVEGVEPPSPMDPRATAGLSIAVVVAALGALVVWRRRVRP